MSGSGSINGNGGLSFFKRLAPSSTPQVEAAAAETSKPKAQGDLNLIGSNSASLMTLAGLSQTSGAAPVAAKDSILGARDLNEFIQNKIKQDFPNLKLTPVQSVGLSTYIRDQLALTGMNDENFKDLKQRLQ